MTKEERDALLKSAHLYSAGDGAASHADSKAMLAFIEPCYKWSDVKLDIDDWVCYSWCSYGMVTGSASTTVCCSLL